MHWSIAEPRVGENYRKLALAVAASEVYDLAWMLICAYGAGWESPESWLKKVMMIVTFVQFVAKVGIGAVFWKTSVGLA